MVGMPQNWSGLTVLARVGDWITVKGLYAKNPIGVATPRLIRLWEAG